MDALWSKQRCNHRGQCCNIFQVMRALHTQFPSIYRAPKTEIQQRRCTLGLGAVPAAASQPKVQSASSSLVLCFCSSVDGRKLSMQSSHNLYYIATWKPVLSSFSQSASNVPERVYSSSQLRGTRAATRAVLLQEWRLEMPTAPGCSIGQVELTAFHFTGAIPNPHDAT